MMNVCFRVLDETVDIRRGGRDKIVRKVNSIQKEQSFGH